MGIEPKREYKESGHHVFFRVASIANGDNPMNDFLLLGRVDTIHELYLRGISQSKSFYNQHFPQTPYRRSGDLPDDLKKQYQKIRRKMAIPMAMGKLIHRRDNLCSNPPPFSSSTSEQLTSGIITK